MTRRRDPENRRVHRVELTGAGEAALQGLLATVIGFDQRRRAGFTSEDIATLMHLLARLRANVTGSTTGEATS